MVDSWRSLMRTRGRRVSGVGQVNPARVQEAPSHTLALPPGFEGAAGLLEFLLAAHQTFD